MADFDTAVAAGSLPDARRAATRVLKADGDDTVKAFVQFTLGVLLEESGDWDGAEDMFTQVKNGVLGPEARARLDVIRQKQGAASGRR